MPMHELAGHPVPPHLLIDVDDLLVLYEKREPDPSSPIERVSFGTSGHRGTPGKGTFTRAHILAITQAICDYRVHAGVNGPMLMGMDTHALSRVAHTTAAEVLIANDIETRIQTGGLPTPTPVMSHAILKHNHGRDHGLADGIIITPSHNPPEDGGFKYNETNGGPADTDITSWIEKRANDILSNGNREVLCASIDGPASSFLVECDFHAHYVETLGEVVDLDTIRDSGIRIGVDPLGGASLPLWDPIADRYHLDIHVENATLDPTFSFMRIDRDGRIRMDCSSPWAMAGLIELKNKYDVAFANDPDADRHGIVVPGKGLLNPNHYLSVAIQYLLDTRVDWSVTSQVGKTLVTSSMVDRVLGAKNRIPYEVPVGFKWFSKGLFDGSLCFGGEESAGASFLRFDGTPWSTDKDGLILCLLAAEITARTDENPGEHYARLEERFGTPVYRRIEAPADHEQKAMLSRLSPESVDASELAGEPIESRLVRAPGNNAPIGGLKVTTENGWFAARPSGTEDIYKIYAESFKSEAHVENILEDAQAIVDAALKPE